MTQSRSLPKKMSTILHPISTSPPDKQLEFMDLAFQVAERIDPHSTSPNPRVGCVVVENGRLLAEGAHQKHGHHHAEVNAGLKFPNLVGCEVYVTLEPCDDFVGKKTPSCTNFLIQREPAKVYVGSLDPNFDGRSLDKLKRAGVEVEYLEGFAERAAKLNPFFRTSPRPYVCVKLAQTLDGRINLDNENYGTGKPYISNALSRQKVHELRAQYAAVLTTTKTVLADDPLLTCRLGASTLPWIHSNPDVVVLGDTKLPQDLRLFEPLDRQILTHPRGNLAEILQHCRTEWQLDSLLVEAGTDMVTQLMEANLVDEIQLFMAPQIAGQGPLGIQHEVDLSSFSLVENRNLDGDIWLRYGGNNVWMGKYLFLCTIVDQL